MSITAASSLKSATAAAEAATGRKFCRKCNSFKPLDGGRFALDSRHRFIWYCAKCTRFTSGPASPATNSEIPTPARARTVTSKLDAGTGLTDFWKLAHKPLEKI
jgi:hypothetical protein